MGLVAVLIVSYRGLADVKRCLAALEASTYRDFKVVIRENGGVDAWSTLRTHLPPRLATGQAIDLAPDHDNLGFAGGVNACLRHAGAAWAYWILNPDTEPEPEALAQLVERLRQGDCSIVGNDLVLPDGTLGNRGGGDWRKWSARAISIDHGRPRNPRPDPRLIERRMNYVIGASMLVSRGFLARVGEMREEYFLYCEEVEWCLRGLAAGERLGYAPDAVVRHGHGTSTGGGGPMRGRSKIAVYLQERNRLHVTRDLYPSLFPIAAILAFLHLCIRYGKARAWRQLGYAVQGWAAGLRGARGRPVWF